MHLTQVQNVHATVELAARRSVVFNAAFQLNGSDERQQSGLIKAVGCRLESGRCVGAFSQPIASVFGHLSETIFRGSHWCIDSVTGWFTFLFAATLDSCHSHCDMLVLSITPQTFWSADWSRVTPGELNIIWSTKQPVGSCLNWMGDRWERDWYLCMCQAGVSIYRAQHWRTSTIFGDRMLQLLPGLAEGQLSVRMCCRSLCACQYHCQTI